MLAPRNIGAMFLKNIELESEQGMMNRGHSLRLPMNALRQHDTIWKHVRGPLGRRRALDEKLQTHFWVLGDRLQGPIHLERPAERDQTICDGRHSTGKNKNRGTETAQGRSERTFRVEDLPAR